MIDEKETYVDDLRIWAWYIAISLVFRSWHRNLPFSSVFYQTCERTATYIAETLHFSLVVIYHQSLITQQGGE